MHNIIVSRQVNFDICASFAEASESLDKRLNSIYMTAENYPSLEIKVTEDFLERAKQKNVRVLIESPEQVDGVEFSEAIKAEYERTLVNSGFFDKNGLKEGTILAQHSCWFRPVITPVVSHLGLAKVAGYRKTVFGRPDISYPVLFQHPQYPNVIISTICLSKLVTARFAPQEDWKRIMQVLLTWLNNDVHVECDWEMSVMPSFSQADVLPDKIEELTLNNNIQWFRENIFFRHSKRICVCEGFASEIEYDGNQYLRAKTRGDCTGEATIITALDWKINRNPASKEITGQIMETLFSGSELPDNNPESPTYGGVRFYEDNSAYYGDDNCRAAMGCILASELTGKTDYIDNIIRCLLFVLNTTGKYGFRHNFLANPSSFEDGKDKDFYRREDFISCHPHFQAYMWAAFLQAYVLTEYSEFKDKAKCAIAITMEKFPDVKWTNGITQEYARLLLPLAFLVQIEDTEKHRNWLKQVAEKLLENLMPCGAIREKMGDINSAQYPAPQSDEDYGTTEAPLIQKNGDPVCDLLYTMNFAFVGIHEAAMATKDIIYTEAENRIAEFLCRIQVSSSSHTYLNGCWMRGFDYDIWEFYGSSADNGWGVWCVESGWTNALISATFGLRKLKRGFLCHANKQMYKDALNAVI